jgi:cytochrome c553
MPNQLVKLKRLLWICLVSCLATASFVSLAAESSGASKKVLFAGDANKGQVIANTVCMACHGVDGNGGGGVQPKLAGLNAEHIYKQLKEFMLPGSAAATEGKRPNAIMGDQVSRLTDEDMRNLSVWYAQQKPKDNVARNKASFDLGQQIWRAGIAKKGIPACAACHGATGAGIPVQYPRLAGQHAEYAEAQLKAFRSGVRKNGSKMTDIARDMTDVEISAVADYAAGLRVAAKKAK